MTFGVRKMLGEREGDVPLSVPVECNGEIWSWVPHLLVPRPFSPAFCRFAMKAERGDCILLSRTKEEPTGNLCERKGCQEEGVADHSRWKSRVGIGCGSASGGGR